MGKGHSNSQASEANLVKAFREIPPEYSSICDRDVFREFWTHARSEKKVFIIIALSTLMQGAVAGSSIYLLKIALDQFFDKTTPSTVLFLIGTLFLATVLKSALEFIFNWKKSVAVARIHDSLVVRAFRDLLLNPFHFHIKERDRKKYRWVLKDAIKFIESFFGLFNAWIKQPFVLLSTIIALWVISPILTLIGMVMIPLGIPCMLFLKRKIEKLIAQRKQLMGVIEEIVSESIRSIRIIKVFGLEEHNVSRLEETIDKQRDINMKNVFFLGLMSPVSEILGFVGLTIIIITGSQSIVGGTFTNGTFFVFIMAFLNIYRPLKDISNGLMNYQYALDAGRRLIVLRRRASEEQHNQGTVPLRRFESLQIKNLWFGYGDDTEKGEFILKNLSLDIKAGETVAIVGPTGAGKTTLCDLICRLYYQQKGDLEVNGTPVRKISSESYTKTFALCSQETIVFNNSLLEEIRIACPEAGLDEVQSVAKAAGLSSCVDNNRRNWNTWVGDRGIQFSGGQRQMIAIARALLRKPQVLILDEAMSGLDVETSRAIWENLRKALPETSIVAISHNWDIIKHCQRVLVLTHGRISKSIKVSDIINKDQFFRELHIE